MKIFMSLFGCGLFAIAAAALYDVTTWYPYWPTLLGTGCFALGAASFICFIATLAFLDWGD